MPIQTASTHTTTASNPLLLATPSLCGSTSLASLNGEKVTRNNPCRLFLFWCNHTEAAEMAVKDVHTNEEPQRRGDTELGGRIFTQKIHKLMLLLCQRRIRRS